MGGSERLTVTGAGMRLGIGVNQDKVQGIVVVAGVHDDPTIIAIPHGQAINALFHQGLGYGVLQCHAARQKETKCRLARSEQPSLGAVQGFSGFGLCLDVSFGALETVSKGRSHRCRRLPG